MELKLELPPEEAKRLARAPPLCDRPHLTARLKSIYFDTPGFDLHRAGYSLRVRHDGQHFVQTLKRNSPAAGLFRREECEQEVKGPRPSVKALARAPIQHRRRLVRELVGQVEVDVERRTWLLEGSENLIEVALDQGVVRCGRRQAPLAELELELKRGSPDQLFALASQLAEAVPLRISVLSKAERGFRLGPHGPNGVGKAGKLHLSCEMPVAEAFPAIVASCIAEYRLNGDMLASEPAALHQGRVALRRLRAALSLFRRIVADERFGPLRDELRKLAAALGQARDLDVFWERHGAELPKHDQDRIRQARQEASRVIANAVGSRSERSLMIDLVGWASGGQWRDRKKAGQPLLAYAGRQLDRRWRKIRKRGRRIEDLNQAERHRLRIEIKKMRYAVEFLSSLFRQKTARSFRNSLVALQELMGDLNDRVAAQRIAEAHSLHFRRLRQEDPERTALRRCREHFRRLEKIGQFWKQ
ncbi:CHAD domain-containing protein [Sphingomonas sp. GCM10030256]|uniref:CYTH and CHAD domain-containing protein n=1 Tax=Sphingomonas sp. GCM10030256 TaxID=3273427 RepID=UPI0036139804